MKIRLHYFGALLLCFVLLCGCVNFCLYHHPQPNEEERWVAEDFEMYFGWVEGEEFVGEISVRGETTKVYVLFNPGTSIDVYPADSKPDFTNSLFFADCKFGKDKLVVTVERDDANLFNGDLPTITFIRQELQEDGTFAVP